MRKYGFVTIAFVLVLSIFIIMMQTDHQNNSTALLMADAFSATGADAVSTEVFIRGELNTERYTDEASRRELMKEIITAVGGSAVNSSPVFSSVMNDVSSGTETDYIINDNRSVHISILKDMEDGKQKPYQLFISLVDTSGSPDTSPSVSELSDVLERERVRTQWNISISGCLEGNLKETETEALYKKVLECMNADKVEGIREDGLISVSAFSPSIRETIRVNGKHVNINMAVRYNSYEGKTYIWLATPVITTEY